MPSDVPVEALPVVDDVELPVASLDGGVEASAVVDDDDEESPVPVGVLAVSVEPVAVELPEPAEEELSPVADTPDVESEPVVGVVLVPADA